MLIITLYVVCYTPDATYAYNPVTRQGYLIAHYITADNIEAN